MNALCKWLNKSVTVTLSSTQQLQGTLAEVDERWLTIQRQKDNVIVVVPVFTVAQVCLDGK